MSIIISHTHVDGTVVDGDPRPHQQVLKNAGFTYRRTPGWFIRNSRDKNAQQWRIDRAAQGLRDAGFDVEVEIDNERRSTADIEADRVERNADRVDALGEKAVRKDTEADTTLARARELGDQIPLGQPILVGHHSEKRHRAHLAKVDRTYGKAFEAHNEAKDAARKAKAAEGNQRQHESLGTTLRRIQRLEAEQRDIGRKLADCTVSGRSLKEGSDRTSITCPACYKEVATTERDDGSRVVDAHGGATGDWRVDLLGRQEVNAEQIAYWKTHVASLQETGVKVWGPDDFVKGDLIKYWGGTREVVRVNKKSLSVKTEYSWTDKVPYDKVAGRYEKQTDDV